MSSCRHIAIDADLTSVAGMASRNTDLTSVAMIAGIALLAAIAGDVASDTLLTGITYIA